MGHGAPRIVLRVQIGGGGVGGPGGETDGGAKKKLGRKRVERLSGSGDNELIISGFVLVLGGVKRG